MHPQPAGPLQPPRDAGVALQGVLRVGVVHDGIAPLVRSLERDAAVRPEMHPAQQLREVAPDLAARRAQENQLPLLGHPIQLGDDRPRVPGGVDHRGGAGAAGQLRDPFRRVLLRGVYGLLDAALPGEVDAPGAHVHPDYAAALDLGELGGQIAHRAETGHRHEVARFDAGNPYAGKGDRGKPGHRGDLPVDSRRHRQQEVAPLSSIAGLVTAVVQNDVALAHFGHRAARRRDASDRGVARHPRQREPGFPTRQAGELGTRAHHRVEGLDEQLVRSKIIGTDFFLLNLHRLRRGKDDLAVAYSHLQGRLGSPRRPVKQEARLPAASPPVPARCVYRPGPESAPGSCCRASSARSSATCASAA